MRRLVAGLVWLAALSPPASGAAEPDWSAIQYGDGVGCGLHVQFFRADGSEAMASGKPTAFFPGGAPSATGETDCRRRCREWAGLSIVKTLAAGYRTKLGVTKVTGTCYLQRRALDPPQVIAAD
jgi:hypothetical protein